MRRRLYEGLMLALVLGALIGVGMLMSVFGLGRATQADVRAVETQVAERCR